jgi:hypothetical protein
MNQARPGGLNPGVILVVSRVAHVTMKPVAAVLADFVCEGVGTRVRC